MSLFFDYEVFPFKYKIKQLILSRKMMMVVDRSVKAKENKVVLEPADEIIYDILVVALDQLISEIPILYGNDPSGWSVIGFTPS
jgi:hypothetical protein